MAGLGGARPGAGRKPKAEKFKRQINATEKAIAEALPQATAQLRKLAEGEFEVVEETWRLESGAKKPRLVERRVKTALPDLKAIVYIINRILGPPKSEAELDAGGVPILKELVAEAENLADTHAPNRPTQE
jgi:flavin-binding protein dodecin